MARSFDTKNLNVEEDRIFEDEFDTLFKISLENRDVLDPFAFNKGYIKYAAAVAKGNSGPGGEFGGRGALGGQLSWNVGRAQVVRSTTYYNWDKTYSASGWQDHLGSSGTKVQANQDVLLCAVGMVSLVASPKLTMVKPTVMDVEMGIENMTLAMRRGTRIQTFIIPWLVPPKEYFYVRGYVEAAGDDSPMLLFVEFGKASYLKSETATTQSGGT